MAIGLVEVSLGRRSCSTFEMLVAFSVIEWVRRPSNSSVFIEYGSRMGRIEGGGGTKTEGIWLGTWVGTGIVGTIIYSVGVGAVAGVALKAAWMAWRHLACAVRQGGVAATIAASFWFGDSSCGFLIIMGLTIGLIDWRPSGYVLKAYPGGGVDFFGGEGEFLNFVRVLLRLLSFRNWKFLACWLFASESDLQILLV